MEAWRTAAALALVWLALLRLVELSTCARRVSKQLVGRAQVTSKSRRVREKGSDHHGFTVWPDNDTSSGIRALIEMKAEAKAIAEAELWP